MFDSIPRPTSRTDSDPDMDEALRCVRQGR